ncbi:hypothetical protein D3C72_1401810 [compost metagenome]
MQPEFLHCPCQQCREVVQFQQCQREGARDGGMETLRPPEAQRARRVPEHVAHQLERAFGTGGAGPDAGADLPAVPGLPPREHGLRRRNVGRVRGTGLWQIHDLDLIRVKGGIDVTGGRLRIGMRVGRQQGSGRFASQQCLQRRAVDRAAQVTAHAHAEPMRHAHGGGQQRRVVGCGQDQLGWLAPLGEGIDKPDDIRILERDAAQEDVPACGGSPLQHAFNIVDSLAPNVSGLLQDFQCIGAFHGVMEQDKYVCGHSWVFPENRWNRWLRKARHTARRARP